ncbi:MAG TPA: RHO alpha subunit C-terminal catalytic domain-containing protein, partial [Kiloniellaceae bacterium]|nr:RHO alpha subunit C-terminal catalytic domain-containing protein [Kiloniellaceae bacterium]
EVFCGFVFVNLDPDAAGMTAWYADAEADLRRYVPEIDSYRPIWTHDSLEACNWKVAVENYNECYHCRFVHPAFTKGVIAAESVDITPKDYTLRHEASAVASEKGSYAFSDNAYHVIFLWPAMSIQVYPGRVLNTYWWRPTAIDATRVYRGWLSPGGDEDRTTMEIAEIDKKTTFVEDLPVVESVQRGLNSRGYAGGPLVLNPKGGVDNERSIQAIHGWVREALETPPSR